MASQSFPAVDMDWLTRYAIDGDRDALLDELIPGSMEHYFYRCLHQQTQGDVQGAAKTLREWSADNSVGRIGFDILQNRQLVLELETDPVTSGKVLAERLGLNTRHQTYRNTRGQRLANRFDLDAINSEQVIESLLKENGELNAVASNWLANWVLSHPNDQLAGKSSQEILEFLTNTDSLSGSPDAFEIVRRELEGRPERQRVFGDRALHSQLTLDEINALAQAIPALRHSVGVVNAILQRLLPNQMQLQDDAIIESQLRSAVAYVRQLPESYASLKVTLVGALLQHLQSQERYERELFMEFLRLPRQHRIAILVPIPIRGRQEEVSLRSPTVPNDHFESIIRQNLEYFLVSDESTKPFEDFFKPEFLNRFFAQSMIMAGKGDRAVLLGALSVDQQQRLRERIELQLANANRQDTDLSRASELVLDVKNVAELTIHIYQIDAEAYVAATRSNPGIQVELDGLLPNFQRSISFDESAFIRHRETIELPEIQGRGVWVVDVLGNGLRSRAFIQRGQIQTTERLTSRGLEVSVVDERLQPVPTAKLSFAGRNYMSDDAGLIIVPFAPENLTRDSIVSDGELAIAKTLVQPAAEFELSIRCLLPEEHLKANQKAAALIRPELRLGETFVRSDFLQECRIRVELTSIDGEKASTTISGLRFVQSQETAVEFTIPERTAYISLNALASYTDPYSGETKDVTAASKIYELDRNRSRLSDAFLTSDSEDWIVEMRGVNGEPIADRIVRVQVVTEMGGKPLIQDLQTAADGSVRIAKDSRLRKVLVDGRTWDLDSEYVQWLSQRAALAGDSITISVQDFSNPQWRLFQTLNGVRTRELKNKIRLKDSSLEISGLDEGVYQLVEANSNRLCEIHVVDGQRIGNSIVSTFQQVEGESRPAVQIQAAEFDGKQLDVRLLHAKAATRVHVYGYRFMPTVPQSKLLGPSANPWGIQRRLPVRSRFVSSLALGDEYVYVLNRQSAIQYAGVMLSQPSLILNPWSLFSTEMDDLQLLKADMVAPGAPMADGERMGGMGSGSMSGEVGLPNYDFLETGPALVANAEVAEDGSCSIAINSMDGISFLQVVASNSDSLASRRIDVPGGTTKVRDLRLSQPLDLNTAFQFSEIVAVADSDRVVEIPDQLLSPVRTIGSLSELFQQYVNVCDDESLRKFEVLTQWDSLDEAEKALCYEQLASHELHLFLYFRDRAYFDRVVGPYLKNKADLQFIDHYLLGNDLSSYAAIHEFQKLNALELVLLCERQPDLKPVVRRLFEMEMDREEVLELVRKSDARGRRRGANPLRLNFGMEAGRAMTLQESVTDFAAEPMAEKEFYFEQVDTTKAWIESNWYSLKPSDVTKKIVPANEFWMAMLDCNAIGESIESECLKVAESRQAVLAALSLTALPFRGAEASIAVAGDRIAPQQPQLVQFIQLAAGTSGDSLPIVLSQQIYDLRDSTGEPVFKQFRTQTIYTARLTVSNSTPERQTFDLLWQIPSGAIAMEGALETSGRKILLEPFATQVIEYPFYFSNAGKFSHYAASATADGVVVGRHDSQTYEVTDQPAQVDLARWENVVEQGTAADIVAALNRLNLSEIDMTLVLPRLSDEKTYLQVIETLEAARFYDERVWAYSLKHGDLTRVGQLLTSRSEFGPYFEVESLSLAMEQNGDDGFIELAPFVMPRIHATFEFSEFVDPQWNLQLQRVLNKLAFQSEIADDDRMRLVFYELIGNHLAQSWEHFQQVGDASGQLQLQKDYFRAYFALMQLDVETARQIAAKYQDYPVKRWERRFQQLSSQIRQYDLLRGNPNGNGDTLANDGSSGGGSEDASEISVPVNDGESAWLTKDIRNATGASAQASFQAELKRDSIAVKYRNLSAIEVRYFEVDIELLFSQRPFVRGGLESMTYTRPSRSDSISLVPDQSSHEIAIPHELQQKTLLILVKSKNQDQTLVFTGTKMDVTVAEQFGQIQVLTNASGESQFGKPVAKAYVKVFCKNAAGNVLFYKDGYTDFRGRFDYASVSGPRAEEATEFSILVLHPDLGASIHSAGRPE